VADTDTTRLLALELSLFLPQQLLKSSLSLVVVLLAVPMAVVVELVVWCTYPTKA
jgi:hypothetical protein